HQDDCRIRTDLFDLDEGIDAADSGHLDVHQNEMEVLAPYRLDRLLSAFGDRNLVTPFSKDAFQSETNAALVVDDKDVDRILRARRGTWVYFHVLARPRAVS